MKKSVYSIVLMDDVVDAVDKLAYANSTSRSNMINRILAEYVSMDTPEVRMQNIFSALSEIIERQSILQPVISASDAVLSLRSALQYKYNPSVKYIVELYPHSQTYLGEMRASLRTQNPTLLLYLGQFYHLWAKLEAAYLDGAQREYEAADGKYTRRFFIPSGGANADKTGEAIADYVALFDGCLKEYFDKLDTPRTAVTAVEKLYRDNLSAQAAEL